MTGTAYVAIAFICIAVGVLGLFLALRGLYRDVRRFEFDDEFEESDED